MNAQENRPASRAKWKILIVDDHACLAWRDDRAYLFIRVAHGNSSVLNGDAGKPAPFHRLTTG